MHYDAQDGVLAGSILHLAMTTTSRSGGTETQDVGFRVSGSSYDRCLEILAPRSEQNHVLARGVPHLLNTTALGNRDSDFEGSG